MERRTRTTLDPAAARACDRPRIPRVARLALLALLTVSSGACGRADGEPAPDGGAADSGVTAAPSGSTSAAAVTPTAGTAAAGNATPAPTDSVEVIPVNRGTHGMAARVRWILSPDRRALIVTEDPAAVENDALPNGFVYASEATGGWFRRDSVWDVAPSPGWTRVAWSRAIVLRAGEQDSLPPSEWQRALAQLPEDVAEPTTERMIRRLRANAFSVSGMAVMYGLGLSQAIDVSRFQPGHNLVLQAPTSRLDAWRVRWTRAGDTLVAGIAPTRSNDDAPAARWVRASPAAGGAVDSSRLAPPAWVTGPTIDISVKPNLNEPRELRGASAVVRSQGGRIQRRPQGDANAAWGDVGPGLPLVATADGRFIAALRAKPNAAEYEAPYELVVYHVPRR